MAEPADRVPSAPHPAANAGFAGMSESDAITAILNSSKTIAIVGLSSNRMRASFHVAGYLQSVGYKIIPVNPNETAVLGEKSYTRLQDVPVSIDVVQIFRRPTFVPEIVEAAIQIKARVVWMQEGIENAEAAERARHAGIFVVMNKCMLKEQVRRSRGVQR
jgi:predicted CoA-binding protein